MGQKTGKLRAVGAHPSPRPASPDRSPAAAAPAWCQDSKSLARQILRAPEPTEAELSSWDSDLGTVQKEIPEPSAGLAGLAASRDLATIAIDIAAGDGLIKLQHDARALAGSC